jgi:hypothetical protein
VALQIDLRERVLVAVEAGEPVNAVAEWFLVGCSSGYRWIAAARDGGRRAPRPTGGGPQPIICAEIEAALRRMLAADNHARIVEALEQALAPALNSMLRMPQPSSDTVAMLVATNLRCAVAKRGNQRFQSERGLGAPRLRG